MDRNVIIANNTLFKLVKKEEYRLVPIVNSPNFFFEYDDFAPQVKIEMNPFDNHRKIYQVDQTNNLYIIDDWNDLSLLPDSVQKTLYTKLFK